ncbi:hypothetical protein [Amycolatopsis jejuensis]|uniref:hypothetical protein n=1 Tax=Amycolatopsis jejuensis TaxID=330084 RepID=UPI000525F445|nr:hypothetical protein [Amycolatopsis jejuensis]
MEDGRGNGDNITVGDITSAQGVAVGRNASAKVTGNNITGASDVDADALRAALNDLYDALADADLSRDQRIEAQTATGNALGGVTEETVDGPAVTSGLEKVGDTLRKANVTVEEGTKLAQSMGRIAAALGPLVGGAQVVANLLGIPL